MQRKKGEECRNAERERFQQWHRISASILWRKGRAGAVEDISMASVGNREDNSTYLLGKTKEELDAVTGKSPLCYGSHARENKKEPFWSSKSSK